MPIVRMKKNGQDLMTQSHHLRIVVSESLLYLDTYENSQELN